MKKIYSSSILLFFVACTANSFGQTEQPQLTATILHLDSAFWNAYNHCDTAAFKNFLTDDVEFYHDKGGITKGADALVATLNKNLCGNANYHLRREAVAGTVHVYPMQNGDEIYGAIISGEHLFYINDNGKPEFLDGDANFSQLWLLKDGIWKMARILSYNHHPAAYINTRKEISLPDAKLDAFTGNYKNAHDEMTLKREGHLLILHAGDNSYTLYPLSDTSFFTKERDLVFEFIKDVNNKPLKIIVKEHGAVADELLFENK